MYFELDEKRFVGYDGDGVEWEAEQIEIDGEIVPNLETVERTGLTLMSYDWTRRSCGLFCGQYLEAE